MIPSNAPIPPASNPNPYDPALPTVESDRFYGQEAAFAFIRQQAFAEKRPRAPLLIGRRGIGKTSILYQVPNRLDSRTIAVYIDLSQIDLGGADAAARFWLTLSETARAALEAGGVSIYRLPELPPELTADQVHGWFIDSYLTVALAAMRQRRLLFLFDDTAPLLDSVERFDGDTGTPTLFDQIGDLLMIDERIKCLFALELAEVERAERHPLLSDPLLVYRVPYLADFEAEALIREPAVFAYGLHSEAARAIRALCGGFPFALHAVNQLIFDRSAARGHASPIMVDDVLAVLPDAIRRIDPICAREWAVATPGEQRILASLSALVESNAGRPITREALYAYLVRGADAVPDETSLIVSLRRLEYQDVIRAYPDRGYVFAVALQQQWLLIYGHLPPPTSLLPVNPPPEAIPAATAVAMAPVRRSPIPPLWIGGLAVLIAAIAIVLLIGHNGSSAVAGGSMTAVPTETLVVNLQGTRQAISVAQTVTAQTGTAQAAAIAASGTSAAQRTLIALTPTATLTPTDTASATSTLTMTLTATRTDTARSTNTMTPSITPTASITVSASTIPTVPLNPTRSATPTQFPSNTDTPIASLTASRLPSRTPSSTATITDSPTATNTESATSTDTVTASLTPSATESTTMTLTASPAPPVTQIAYPTHLVPTSKP